MLCSLCGNVFAADATKINAALDKSEISTSTQEQTVTVEVKPEQAMTAAGYGIQLVVPDGWTIAKIESNDPHITIDEETDCNLIKGNAKYGTVNWMTANLKDTTISGLVTYTVTVPANVEANEYTFTVTKVKVLTNKGTVEVPTEVVNSTLTLTVKDNTPAADGYTVAVSGDATIQTGEEAQVKLNITHSDTDVTSYAAYSMKVNYNKDVLTYKDKSFSDADATVTDDGNGTLTIRRFGKDLELGKDLTLSFTGKAGGESKVKVSEAKVDKSENALKNAPEATVTGSATITVAQTYKVTLPDNVTGEAIASSNKDYTFTLKNGLDGTYMDVKYKIGEGEEKEPTRNADGSYTIPKDEITGEIVITAVGKTYTVTKEGTGKDDVTLSGATATYGTDYKFTLNGETGYVYDMTVTVGGEKVVPAYDEATKAYTIDGNKITGDIVITVNESKNEAQIIFAGNGAEDVEGGQATRTATPGQNFVFKINKVTGYTYTVTAAKADGTAVTVTENPEGTYTIAGADIKAGDVITITVEKKAIETKYTIEVNEYVTLDGKAVFLITAKLNKGVTLAEGRDTLLAIRRDLNGIKDCRTEFLLSRAMTLAAQIDEDRIKKLLREVQNRIDFLNLTTKPIDLMTVVSNEEVVKIVYEFFKVKISIMDMSKLTKAFKDVSDIDGYKQFTDAVTDIQKEIRRNKNTGAEKIVSLEDLLKKIFVELEYIDLNNLSEVNGKLLKILEDLRCINEENERLAARYGGNYAFVKTYSDVVEMHPEFDKEDLAKLTDVAYAAVKDIEGSNVLILHGRESFVNTVKKNTTTQLLKSGLYKKLNLKDWYADFLGETYSNMRIF